MKTVKKSKPKQRTNWKQRALHCEEVIGILNILAEMRKRAHAEVLARAESAEKHNALLLEERERREIAESAVAPQGAVYTEYSMLPKVRNRPYCLDCFRLDCDGSCVASIYPPPTEVPECCKETLCRSGAMEASWERFKSWAKGIRQRKPREVTTRL